MSKDVDYSVFSKKVNPNPQELTSVAGSGIKITITPDRREKFSTSGGGGGGRDDATKIITSVAEPAPDELIKGDYWFHVKQ